MHAFSSIKILVAEATELIQRGIESMLVEAGITEKVFCLCTADDVMKFGPFYKPSLLSYAMICPA
jgi:hypothetical protein